MASHSHQQGTALQYMRTAPKQPNRHHSATRSQSPHDYQDIDPASNHFARDAESSSHFQVLDDKGLAIEQQRIDDAARRVLSRRKKGPSKAWGAPASTQEDYRRSLMPRSPKSRTESKPRSPQRRHNQLSKEDSDVLNYAFIPESERLQRAADQANKASRPSTAGVDGDRKRGGAGRKTNSGLEEIPSDFVDKLHLMRNNSVAEEKELEEKYEADKSSPARFNSNRHHQKGSPVKSWTNAVREAFVDERNPTNNETKKRRPNSKRSSRPVRKKANTVPQPFAGVEARSTIKTVSRSMERVMADLALKREEEEKAAQYKWHAKPIPRAVKENRYQAILDKAEATRIKESAARKQRLSETLQPFPGLERREKEGKRKKQQKEEQRLAALAAEKMEAKRKKERSQRKFRQAAAKSAAAEQDRGAADVERRARVQRRAAKLLHSSKMPARMEMWEKTKKQNAQDNQEQDHNGAMTNKMKLNKISSMDAGDIRKYFQRSQLKFKKSLQQARQSRPKAASRPFAFMSAERKVQEAARRKQTEERLRRTEDKRILEKTKKERRQKELAKKLKGMKHPIPRQTEKTKKAQEKVKAAIKKRADDAAKKISDNAAREERVRVSTEDMQAELNRRIKQGDAMRIKPKDPKEMAAEGQRQMRAQLKRLKTSVANAVSKRRFLFDQYKVDARKRDARKAALEKIGKAVFDVPMDGGSSSHNSSWKASAKKDEHRLLNNDEKEEMELYDDDEFEFEDEGTKNN